MEGVTQYAISLTHLEKHHTIYILCLTERPKVIPALGRQALMVCQVFWDSGREMQAVRCEGPLLDSSSTPWTCKRPGLTNLGQASSRAQGVQPLATHP